MSCQRKRNRLLLSSVGFFFWFFFYFLKGLMGEYDHEFMWIRGRGGGSHIQHWMSSPEVKLLDAEHTHGSVSVSPWWPYVKQQFLSFKQHSFTFSPARESMKKIFVGLFNSLWIWDIFRISFSVKYVGNKYSCRWRGDTRNTGGDIFLHLKKLAPATALWSFMVRNIRCQIRCSPGEGATISHCSLLTGHVLVVTVWVGVHLLRSEAQYSHGFKALHCLLNHNTNGPSSGLNKRRFFF